MYAFESRVRYSEVNPEGVMKPSSIINYFQDCSTFQSEDLGRGLSYLNSINRVWLMNGWQVEVNRFPNLGETIKVGTWAYDFKGFYGYRNFIMKDENDVVLTVANSIWVHMDTKTGRPVRVPEGGGGYDLEPPYEMEYGARKIDIPEQLSDYLPFPVLKSNIDVYNHVNNGQYIKMAEEFLPEQFQVTKFRVEYRLSAVFGDIIVPKISSQPDCITVVLANSLDAPYSIIQFQGYDASNQA
ncbi:MAG: acyl-ACP thioesterase [Herbinix sp.]|jgi:acyl-ACP thioesterase|nr:acyl-ACP thioesterase [Herbinix sp.]